MTCMEQTDAAGLSEAREKEILAQVKSGEHRNLGLLIDAHGAALMSYLLAITGNLELAEDVFQDVWVRVMERIDHFDPSRSFPPWLFRVARNLAYDRLRYRRWRGFLRIGKAGAEERTMFERFACVSHHREEKGCYLVCRIPSRYDSMSSAGARKRQMRCRLAKSMAAARDHRGAELAARGRDHVALLPAVDFSAGAVYSERRSGKCGSLAFPFQNPCRLGSVTAGAPKLPGDHGSVSGWASTMSAGAAAPAVGAKPQPTRTDLLTFTTAPLEKSTEITGPMTATLWAATDARDTDWNIMILDVFPDGKALRIQDGVVRARFRNGFDHPSLLTPGEICQYNIDLWFTALVLPAGHSIRVAVASAAFPKYDRNLNTGGDNERGTKYVAAQQRIFHDAEHPSRVRLPIIPR